MGRLLLRALVAGAAGLAILFAVLAWLLSVGPISLGFLSPYLEDALREAESEFRVDFDDLVLTWAGWDRRLDVRAVGVRVLRKDGDLVASLPEASVGLSARALIRGRIGLTSLDMIGPKARLVRRADGRIDFGLEGEVAAGGGVTGRLLEGLLRPPDPSRVLGYLRRLSILDADITLDDQISETSWRAPRADVVLVRDEAGIDGNAEVDVELGGALVHLIAQAAYNSARREAQVRIRFSDIDPARLQGAGVVFARLAAVEVPVSGTVEFTVDPGGTLSRLAFDLEAGPGHVDLPERFEGTLPIARLKLRGRVTDGFDGVDLESLFVDFDGPEAGLKGRVSFAKEAGGVRFDLDAGPGFLNLPDRFEESLPIARLAASGRVNLAFDALRLESLFVDLEGPTVTLSGSVSFAEEGAGFSAEGAIRNLPVAEVKRLWPLGAVPKPRQWIMSHLHDGLVRRALFRIDAPPGTLAPGPLPDEAVAVDFVFEGLSATYYGALPPVTDGWGTARLNAARFDLTLTEGRVAGLELAEGAMSITGLNGPHQRVQIDTVVTGSVREAMALLDREPLGFARAVGLDPSSLGGMSSTRIRFRLPAKRNLRPREIEFAAVANLRDAAIPNLYDKYSLTAGTLSLQADGGGVSLSGRAALNGVPLEVAWQRRFGPKPEFRSRYQLSGTLDGAAREALFLPTGEYVKGPVAANLEIIINDDAVLQATANVELRRAQVTVPELHWRKPAEANGSLQLLLRKTGDGDIRFDSFTIAASDLTASGQAEFDPDWILRGLDLSRLAFGGPRGTDVSVSLRPKDGGGFLLALEGERLDLRPYLDQSGDDGGQATMPPLAVSARLGRVIVGDDQELSEIEGTATHNGAGWQTLQMVGALKGGAVLELRLRPRNGTREVRVTSTDAGSVARALDIFLSGQGGKLTATAVIHDDLPGRPIDGEVIVDDFRLVEAPALARILSLGSLSGIVDLLNGEGINFVRFAAPFTLAGEKVTLKEARAYGPALGITLEGVIDRGADTTDLKGMIVPAYTINSLLGKIPLLGDILVGKEGEGVFALTYSVKGANDNPRIMVNPLSVLAPGFLRRMLFLGAGGEGLPEREAEEEQR